jgi:hypothetical protein
VDAALLAGSAPAGEARSRRIADRLIAGPLLTLALGACAALPVIAAAGRALHEGYQPVADRGIIATRAFDVFSSHTPLVGQYSFAGAVTGKLTYSLGPMLYWLLAPAAHIGAPASFVLTMAAVNVACVLGAVALARRRGGVWLALAAAVGIAVMCRSIAANNFYDVWNPSAGLFPLLALIFLCWSLAAGEYRLLPLTILLGSFELQCEDAFVPPALAALAVGLGGLALWWFQGRRARRPISERPAPPRTVWRWVLAAVLVLCACWAPTVVDQVAHSGNAGKVIEAASERHSPLGPTVGVHAVVRTLGLKPWWLQRVGYPFQRKYDVRHAQGALASASAALMVAWLVLAIALAVRRRRRSDAAGATLALTLCAAVWSVAEATPSTPKFLAETLGYTLWSATTVGMFAWLLTVRTLATLSCADRSKIGQRIAHAVSQLAERARARSRAATVAAASFAAVALAAVAGAAGAAAGRSDEHAFEFHALSVINAHLGAVPRGHSVFLNARLDGLITPLRPEMTYDLRRRGVRALGNGAYLRTGHWYERSEHRYDYIVWAYDDNRLPVPGARVIAHAHITSGGRTHTVTVALSRAEPAGRPVIKVKRPPRGASAPARRDAPARSAAVAQLTPGAAIAWSAPGALGGCAAGGPRAAFPSQGPSDPTGPGAIVWLTDSSACAAGVRSVAVFPPRLEVAEVGAGARVLAQRTQSIAVGAATLLGTVGASLGRVAVALHPLAREASIVLQGRTSEALAPALRGAGELAIARAYLGDVAVATVEPRAISVRVQRWFERGFEASRRFAIAAGPVTGLTVTLDYRADVLVAWQQSGSIYAHILRASGVAQATQRVGASAPDPQLRALVSDNDHGMLAWSSSERSRGKAMTRVEVALSQAGVRFVAPRRLATFDDPIGAGLMDGSLQLVRLSTENVLLAWTARESGHYVVRTAPAVFAASRPSTLLSDPTSDAVLADLATGPAGEAIALWRQASAETAFSRDAQLWAARVTIQRGDSPVSSSPGAVAGAHAVADATLAVDPASDRPLAVWRSIGAQPRIEYAVGSGASGYHPRATVAAVAPPHGTQTHWLHIALAALALVALALTALWLRARSRRTAERK